METLKQRLQSDIKAAMKAKDKPQQLTVLRLITAAIKQREVDERIELSDEQVLAVLDKMTKQRRESLKAYLDANRTELAEQEQFEIDLIQNYLPEQLSTKAIEQLVKETIAATNATTIQDMGKVMAIIKPKVQGRADMRQISESIKQLLS